VFTARYALSPYIKQIRFVFKGLKCWYDGRFLSCGYLEKLQSNFRWRRFPLNIQASQHCWRHEKLAFFKLTYKIVAPVFSVSFFSHSFLSRTVNSNKVKSITLPSVPPLVPWLFSSSLLFFGAIAKLRKETIRFVISVCRSVRLSIRTEQLCSCWIDFHEIWYLNIFRNSV
jgi:hypothetical protein